MYNTYSRTVLCTLLSTNIELTDATLPSQNQLIQSLQLLITDTYVDAWLSFHLFFVLICQLLYYMEKMVLECYRS